MLTVIRQLEETDAEAYLTLRRQLDSETPFMLLEPGERQTTVDEVLDVIRASKAAPNAIMLVADEDGILVGVLEATGGAFRRNRHSLDLNVGVLQKYVGQGIGTRLFQELERWALDRNIHRLELTAMTHNETAIIFYEELGFEVEGTRRDSLLVDGDYVDEYWMAKLL